MSFCQAQSPCQISQGPIRPFVIWSVLCSIPSLPLSVPSRCPLLTDPPHFHLLALAVSQITPGGGARSFSSFRTPNSPPPRGLPSSFIELQRRNKNICIPTPSRKNLLMILLFHSMSFDGYKLLWTQFHATRYCWKTPVAQAVHCTKVAYPIQASQGCVCISSESQLMEA
jgi:hypothetical protein